MNDIKISVVIPTYNRPDMLRRAVLSVLAQNENSIEVLVINDGSTVCYRSFLERYGPEIRYFECDTSQGPATARNIGVKCARGRWILFLDDDDELAPGYLHAVLREIATNRSAQAFWGNVKIVSASGESNDTRTRFLEFSSRHPSRYSLYKEFLSIGSSFGLAMNSAVIEQMGFFDSSYEVAEDTELFLRFLSEGHTPQLIPQLGIIKHETHNDRLSHQYSSYSRLRVYERMFNKHRAFLERHKENYSQLLMWSYRVHRISNSLGDAARAKAELINMGYTSAHIDECWATAADLSLDFLAPSSSFGNENAVEAYP